MYACTERKFYVKLTRIRFLLYRMDAIVTYSSEAYASKAVNSLTVHRFFFLEWVCEKELSLINTSQVNVTEYKKTYLMSKL